MQIPRPAFHRGYSGTEPTPTPPSLTFWALGGGGGFLGGLGGPPGRVLGTPTFIPQKDPLVALVILNTHMWGFKKHFYFGGGGDPGSQGGGGGGGGWMGEVRGQKKFHVLLTYLDSL